MEFGGLPYTYDDLYLLAKIICVVVKIILVVISEKEPIRTPVHLAGAALGMLESLLYVWIALYLIRLVSVTDFGASLALQVAESPYLSVLDQNNLLAGFLGHLFGL